MGVSEDIKRSNTLKEFQNKIKIWKPMGCTCRLCIYLGWALYDPPEVHTHCVDSSSYLGKDLTHV